MKPFRLPVITITVFLVAAAGIYGQSPKATANQPFDPYSTSRRDAPSYPPASSASVGTETEARGSSPGAVVPRLMKFAGTLRNAGGTPLTGVVDVTFSTDHPGLEKKELGEHSIGGGPVLTRGAVISPVVFRLLRETADAQKIPFSLHAAGRVTGTDADAINIAGQGVATGLVSVPNRYMHSPNEMVSLVDLDRAATLLAETCRRVDERTDFTAR